MKDTENSQRCKDCCKVLFCLKFSKVEKQISSCSEFCSEGTSNIGIPLATEFEGFTKGVRQFETKSFTKGVTLSLNISTQDTHTLDRSLYHNLQRIGRNQCLSISDRHFYQIRDEEHRKDLP